MTLETKPHLFCLVYLLINLKMFLVYNLAYTAYDTRIAYWKTDITEL